MNNIHRMTMELHEGTFICVCPICGREVMFDDDGRRVIDPGDETAAHSGSVGLEITGVEVEQDG